MRESNRGLFSVAEESSEVAGGKVDGQSHCGVQGEEWC